MAQSSPEGIELNKGSRLISLNLSVNNKKILSTDKPKLHTQEFLEEKYSEITNKKIYNEEW